MPQFSTHLVELKFFKCIISIGFLNSQTTLSGCLLNFIYMSGFMKTVSISKQETCHFSTKYTGFSINRRLSTCHCGTWKPTLLEAPQLNTFHLARLSCKGNDDFLVPKATLWPTHPAQLMMTSGPDLVARPCPLCGTPLDIIPLVLKRASFAPFWQRLHKSRHYRDQLNLVSIPSLSFPFFFSLLSLNLSNYCLNSQLYGKYMQKILRTCWTKVRSVLDSIQFNVTFKHNYRQPCWNKMIRSQVVD